MKKYILVFFILFAQFFGSIFYFILFANTVFSKYLYSGVKLCLLLLPIFLVGLIPIKKILYSILFRFPKKTWVIYALITGFLMSCIILLTYWGSAHLLLPYSNQIKQRIIDFNLISPYFYWGFAILFSFFHSLFEELYWRWFAFNYTNQYLNDFITNILINLAFASHHFIVGFVFLNVIFGIIAFLSTFIAGIIWSFLYKKTNSLWASWISHIFVDFVLFIIGWLLVF